ncbi:HAMP domain-containing histidine kinase [Sulfurovum sp. XGS-02]|uniref:sensor histidine kinase n=1 Tax=Sulfurovum sp. XGS-02 TaxID=2925411 RepID=UPI002059DA0F|nr:HAMP domain-containing sensor histidine kinase [Sulfurovum sp. XGS-02]UPT78367.1 HAMP domain-containing histidine kinase [Sulfurovum sp. XGS-02]
MLVLKNKATNSLLRSEKKSLLRFLTLYVAMVIFLITLLSRFYYQSQEKLILSDHRAMMTKYAYIQTRRLKVLHHFFPERTEYPRDPRFKSAIYDLEHMKIFSLLEDENVRFDAEEIYITNSHIHLVKMLDEFYLGTKYLIIEIEDSGAWRGEIWKNIITYGIAGFIFFMLFGLYLAKLFLKPMRDSIVLLDRFIKDTTHELNTPLSAILANIEMMDTDVMVEKNKTKLARINIAAKTVSVLYKDLTYLMLEEDKENHDEEIDIRELIYNRVEYFSVLAQSKHIAYDLDLEEATIMMDRRKITRVIDNLISNAIKYNKRNGTIGIRSREGFLVIWDTGIGINEEKIPFIFDRYMRFNKSEGGFGIGLSIVKKIVDEYDISIEVVSKEGEGTKMVLRW